MSAGAPGGAGTGGGAREAGPAAPGGAQPVGAAVEGSAGRRVLTWGAVRVGGGEPVVAVSLTGPGQAQVQAQAARAVAAGADVLELRIDLLDQVRALLAGAKGEEGGQGASRRAARGQDGAGSQGAAAGGGHEGTADSALPPVLPPQEGSLREAGAVWASGAAQAALEVAQAASQAAAAAGGAPLVVTLRTAGEGGRAEVSDAAYEAFLLALVEDAARVPACLRPVAVDVELGRGCLVGLARAAHARGIDVVASFHDVTSTPSDAVLEDVLARMVSQGADLAKVAVWPADAADVARLLGVTARARLPVPLATMSMGGLGAVSRVAAVFGSALTFAVVPDEHGRIEASAPGQLPVAQVRRCLALLAGSSRRATGKD